MKKRVVYDGGGFRDRRTPMDGVAFNSESANWAIVPSVNIEGSLQDREPRAQAVVDAKIVADEAAVLWRAPQFGDGYLCRNLSAGSPCHRPCRERRNRYTQGSQAAIEFPTSPERMAELRQALVAASPDQRTIPPYFQALPTTTVKNAVPGTTRIVAVRTIAR